MGEGLVVDDGGRAVGRGDGAGEVVVGGPEAVPAEGPAGGGEAGSVPGGVGVAAGDDVGVDEVVEGVWVRRSVGGLPGGEVEEAGTGEGSGPIEESPAVGADVEVVGLEVAVAGAPGSELCAC